MENEEIVYNNMVEGIKYLSLEKYQEAILRFDDILKIDDSNLAALNNKAISLNGLKEFDEALVIFDYILNIDPNFEFSLMGKGESLFGLGYYDSAILYFDRVLKIDANNDLALLNKAYVYEECNQYKEALKCLDKMNNISKYSPLGRNYYSKILNQSKKETFNQRVAFIKKINAYVNLNEFEDVYKICDDALNYDNRSLYFLFNKAYSAYRIRKYEKSLLVIDEVLKIDFMNIDALDIQSRIFIKLERYGEALDCLNRIKKFGGYFDSSLYKNISLKANMLNEQSENVNDLIWQGNDLILENDFYGALDCYDAALKLDSSSLIALNNKAYVFYLLGEYMQAISYFNSVLMIDENHVSSLLGKSYSLFHLNYYIDSLNCFNKAVECDNSLLDYEYIRLLNEKIDAI